MPPDGYPALHLHLQSVRVRLFPKVRAFPEEPDQERAVGSCTPSYVSSEPEPLFRLKG